MTALLEIRDICVEVDSKEILHNINLAIPDGEVHALLGPNGSGKTSLMMTVMGFSEYKVTKGQIVFNGQDINELDITARAEMGIGVGQQRPPTISGVKLGQILDFAVSVDPRRNSKADELIDLAEMKAFISRDVNDGLSGGEIKRSELLQLLITQPRFAMLDEPDSGVDIDAMEVVGSMVNMLFTKDMKHPAKRRAGLLITHTGQILDYVRADKAHIMIEGHLVGSGNADLILETIIQSGYKACVRCLRERSISQ